MNRHTSHQHRMSIAVSIPLWLKKAANYFLKYVLIIVFSLGALYLAYSLHTSMIIVGVHFGLESNLLWILDVLGTVVLGSILLFCIAAIDSFIQLGLMWPKIIQLTKVEAIAAALVLALEFLLKTLLRAS
jgi:hypothetical protein